MATVSRTFSVRNGLDVANTVVLDSNRNLSNIANVNATSFVTSAGLNVTDQANNAYAAANAAANTVRVSVNGAGTLSGKQLNFVNTATSLITLSDAGNGNANIEITVVGGGAIGAAYDQANAAYAQANAAYGQANTAYDQANAAYNDSNTRVLKAGDTMTGQLNISSGGLLVTGNVGFGIATPTSNLHVVGNANITTGIYTSNINVTETTTSNNFVSTRTALAAPNLLNFNGERVRLYDFNQSGHPNYAIGVEANYIWLGTDNNQGTTGVKFYGNTTQGTVILSNGTIQTTNTVEAKVIKANGTGTAIDASQGNVLTNQVTGTQFNFLNGLYTVSLNGGGSTSNYTLSLPANTGLVGQSLVTDGTGNLSWSSASFDQANAAYGQANAAYGQANLAYNQANAAYGQANAAYNTANLKVASISVSGNGLAVSNTTSANLNDYTISVNTASTTLRGTTLLIDDINSSDTGNAATANAVKTAWDYANTKLSLSGGTVGGSLNISGNLTVTGNTSYVNVQTYIVDDPLIYLAANNETSDLVDIGFMGGHNTAGVYQHSGLARHAADGNWYLFTGLAEEGHENNVVDIANTTYATLRANLYAQQLNVVTGFANIAVPLTVAGNTTLKANLVAQQNVNVTGTLNVAGLTEFTNNVLVSAPLNVNSTLNVTGTSNFATTNVNGVLTITNAGEGLVVANANVTNKLTVGSLAITTNTITTSSTGQVVLDKFATTAFASAKYFVQANSGVDYTTTEVIVVQDGTNVWLTEYGTIQTGPSIGTFSADIDSGDVRLLFNANNNINTIRSIRYGVLPP